MIYAQCSFDGIGRAEHHRVLARKLRGIPTEIIFFKASSGPLPMIPGCQLRTEQLQRFLGELIHFFVKSVVFQPAIQCLLLVL